MQSTPKPVWLVRSTDSHFAWMMGEPGAGGPDDLRLPADGVDDPIILGLLRRGAAAMEPERYTWLIVSQGEVVGLIGLKQRPLPGRAAEIGFGIAPMRRGLGHATAAIRELVRCLRDDGVHGPLTAETHVDNRASQRVLARAGFREVASRTDEEDGDLLVWCLDATA